MKKFLLVLCMVLGLSGMLMPSFSFAAEGDSGGTGETKNLTDNFSDALTKTTEGISTHLDASLVEASRVGTANAIIKKVIDVFFNVMVVVGVLVAMIGLYQVLMSSDEGKVKTGGLTLLYGVLGIIVMFSASYLTDVIFNNLFAGGAGNAISNTELLKNIYDKMVFPFIKIAMYLSLGILVVIMMIRVFTYITSSDEGTKKKSMGVIVWTAIGMLFIIGAKQIVEAVYGEQSKVMNGGVWKNLPSIGSKILDPSEIPIVFNVINWALGLVAFVLLTMIIIQTYKMLVKPDDAATFTSLKKTIIYALAGILLIGSAYLLANLFIIGG